ncbi:MAG: metal-dependent hydrolase [Acidobacteriaceae bacterium]|nr:metal-dependent hydrolase [Acidobacteriaceae bacterium]MBV9294547.1 metal-dependent hydrolase [Acidobacteriaceae bacterium]MBV9765420.1 metal-dependent hydrolase [Acidobacteriaceae bacterium]
MDNITHSLTGLALARAGLNRFCPRATLLLILSANAPDLDIVGVHGGTLRYLEVHRGYSHSLLCLPFLALVPVLLVAGMFRQKLPWLTAWVLCAIGVGSHLVLDCTNSYGIRLFLPFSSLWFHLDWNSLYDGCILAVLAFAALWPHFAGLVNREIGTRGPTGRGTAIFALVFLVLFDAGRAILHQRAIAQLQARLYEDAPPVMTAALPEPFTPFRWTGIVETASAYRMMPVNPLGDLDTSSAQIFYKPSRDPAIENAAATPPFRYFRYFARFPVWTEEPFLTDEIQGKRIDLTDLRFGVPGAGSFHCIALEDGRGQVLRSWFTYGSGSDAGSGARKGR